MDKRVLRRKWQREERARSSPIGSGISHMSTDAIRAASGDSITRASLYEYVQVLQQVQTIYNALKSAAGSGNVSSQVTAARQLAALQQELSQMEGMSLISASKLNQLAQSITGKLQNLTSAVNNPNMGSVDIANAVSAFAGDASVGSLLQTALDPTQWDQVTGSTNVSQTLHILDSPQDFAFYELYRTTEAGMNNTVGLFGNSLQGGQQLLQALNLLSVGPTWNPGSDYIDTSGQLQDAADGSSWYTKFSTDQVDTQMNNGLTQLYTIQQNGYFAAGSAEANLIADIIAKFTNPDTANGGFNKASTKDGAYNMWSNGAFGTELQNGIQLVTNLNETAQDQLQRVMLSYQQVTQTLTTMNSRISDVLKSIAQKLNVDKGG